MNKKAIEIEEDGTPYDVVCEHGVHFGGYRCVVCHPEKLQFIAWLFSDEMDEAAAEYKARLTQRPPDRG